MLRTGQRARPIPPGSSGQRQLAEWSAPIGLRLQQSGHVRAPREDGTVPVSRNRRRRQAHRGAVDACGVEECLRHLHAGQVERTETGMPRLGLRVVRGDRAEPVELLARH